jgi:hypothetical protein
MIQRNPYAHPPSYSRRISLAQIRQHKTAENAKYLAEVAIFKATLTTASALQFSDVALSADGHADFAPVLSSIWNNLQQLLNP